MDPNLFLYRESENAVRLLWYLNNCQEILTGYYMNKKCNLSISSRKKENVKPFGKIFRFNHKKRIS